jgi:alkyl sulfatase BDS1-like metallo-beta-lactamase superfamily hydrolase
MKKVIIILSFAALLSSCGSEYVAVDKYGDADQKYEYAKECFAIGKFQNAVSLLEDLVTMKKGTEEAREVAAKTLDDVKAAMKINYFDDNALIQEQIEKYKNA